MLTPQHRIYVSGSELFFFVLEFAAKIQKQIQTSEIKQ